jgi:hypothetical protein
MIEICKFCNSSLKDKYSLKKHLIRNKKCIKSRENKNEMTEIEKLQEEINNKNKIIFDLQNKLQKNQQFFSDNKIILQKLQMIMSTLI